MSASDFSSVKYDSNMSRRDLLRVLAIAGSASMLNCGCRNSKPPAPLIQVYGTGTLSLGERPEWDRATKDQNFSVEFTDNMNDTGPVIASMLTGTAARTYDLGALQGGAERELAEAGVILPWDLARIPNWSRVWPLAKDIPYTQWDGKQYGIPIAVNADSMIYLPDEVGVVDTYHAIFDPKLKGRTSMEDAWINSAIFTAMYLKENSLAQIADPGDLTPDELGVVMEFLIKKKRDGQFRKLWSGWKQGLDLIKNKEVVVMTGWEPIMKAAVKDGINAKYAVPIEGYEGWSNDLILHVGAREHKLDALAHEFANWALSGYYGCELATLRGFTVPSDLTVEYAKAHSDHDQYGDVERTAKYVRDKFNTKGGRTFWQNVRPKEYKRYEEWWSKLRAA